MAVSTSNFNNGKPKLKIAVFPINSMPFDRVSFPLSLQNDEAKSHKIEIANAFISIFKDEKVSSDNRMMLSKFSIKSSHFEMTMYPIIIRQQS